MEYIPIILKSYQSTLAWEKSYLRTVSYKPSFRLMDKLIFLWYYICRNHHHCVCLVNFISAVLINLNRNKSNGV